MSALPPAAGLALAVRLLEARGFAVSGRNARGDSLYLTPAGSAPASAGALRVSNHARTPKQRRTHPEVLTSLVVAQPRTTAQVLMLVEAALRNYEEAARRRMPASGPHAD